VLSVAASLVIVAVAVAVLRGSGEPRPRPKLAAVDVRPVEQLPPVGRWRVTVAATLSGHPSSVTVFHGETSGTPAMETIAAQVDPAAAQALQARLQATPDAVRQRTAVVEFVDPAGIASPREPSRDDSRTAVASASRLGGALGSCLKGLRVAGDTIATLMEPVDEIGLGTRPHVTFSRPASNETLLSQVGILGRGKRRIAVAIVARLDAAGTKATADGHRVLLTLAKWVDKNLHVPGEYEPDC
jgi:hypothetical protein